ncbi:AMP-binding protein [Anaeromyxobacter sp. Fw109-5]|uniref:AMP-binding protein n=1 Tax=Anaeromyxobacter sp. (strain Fw109-5) TaxID=404589 RepID=UPI0000ED7EEE|nr:AMP-binding protein [Anaeromyxobacter sp. Fw109-5]ABS25420.1 AMP-dependent synthetase and ligase [Anaeromyxobacter sp. Fw109-5]
MTERRDSPARHAPAPAPGRASPGAPPLEVGRALAGRKLLLTGTTGFVGKVALSMLLDRYPDVGRVFVVVRPGTGGTAEARFFDKVAPSRPFDTLRARHGAGFDAFLREKCVPLAGDVTDPLLGLSEADLARLEGLDAIVNSAGLVDFDPSLELALAVNVHGPRGAVELCRCTGAALLHVSTCFVAGNRDGVVHEDEELVGYFPRREGVEGRPKAGTLDAADFGVESELADATRRVEELRARADDRVLQSQFRDRAVERLRAEGRAGDEKALRLAIGRERRLWLSGQLVEAGMTRARHWGWPNTYTYTKSLGEQVIAGSDVVWSIVRPSIVESALRFPFPGWNEGFTTSAPLAFMALKGHRSFPAAEKAILDVVPVDLVAAAMIAATAELVERRDAVRARPAAERPPGRVYHLASGDVNPLWARRAVELTALYRRRFFREREEGNRTWNRLLSRLEPYSVSRAHYEAASTPALSALARGAKRLLRETSPRWGAPRLSALAEGLSDSLDELEARLEQTKDLWELYLPFVCDNRYVFRCAAIRALYARLGDADRARIPWDPEALDWRRYWLDVHMKGMEEWVFPGLEEESDRRVHAPKAHRDLLELLDAACERWEDRVALRMQGAAKSRLTYGELRRGAGAVAAFLRAAGVARGDRVLLASENRPEWAVAYFGILRAGAAAVPVDPQLTERELANLWRTAGARLALLSDDAAERSPGLAALAAAAVPGARAALLAEALAGGPAPAGAPAAKVGPDDLASLIFTSGTTGTPKGVMLSHRNFASLVAKLVGTFELGPGDGMLSVLPLHHTFEFTCGLLVPLSRGAEIEYLDELTSDRISEALSSGRVTAMIGVPALWSLLHRRITQELAAKPGVVEGAFRALMKGNAALRDSELGLNLGKLLFWPVHRRFGGRLRLLVSGGSALDPEVQKAFRELGFDLYEGYGLTEAAPVLAVSQPHEESPEGSVGPALPGVELRIAEPDADGVGEVLARGPNVMLGYWRGGANAGVDPEQTGQVLDGGWLRTGDLGKLDEKGNLTLVGRKKDVIIDANGKNVYPDEIEEAYREPELVKELCVVGLPDGTGEKVAMILVPEYGEDDREEVRARLEAHVRAVSATLPFAKRVKVWHVVDAELPKTATRKVKRGLVREELLRLEAAAQKGRRAREAAMERGAGDGWLLDLLAEVSRRPRSEVTHESRLATDLGFDSLMLTELAAALEETGVPASTAEHLQDVQTVGELARVVASAARRHAPEPERAPAAQPASDEEIPVPATIAKLGRRLLGLGQRALYHGLYDAKVVGAANVPHDRNVLVVANHASHLDMGLVKVALGEEGRRLAALAARDYFFDTRVKRAYFENFTNLIPMEREGSLKASLKAAAEALRRGYHLLIFPEGTRSRDGELQPFFPTAGYLALQCNVDVLPVHLAGTFDALPPGRNVPRAADLEVRFGPPIPVAELRGRVAGLARSEGYKAATQVIEDAVRALRAASRGARATSSSTPTPTSTSTQSPEAGERSDSASAAARSQRAGSPEAGHPERSVFAPAETRSRGTATTTRPRTKRRKEEP